MNYRKVYGGTPVGDASLCDTCIWGQVILGYSANERITICQEPYPDIVIPFKVRECSSYANRSLPEYEEMEQIAWDLTKVKAVKPAGFKLVGGKAVESAPGTGASDEETTEPEPAAVGFTRPGAEQD